MRHGGAPVAEAVWCYRCGTVDDRRLYGRTGAPWRFLCASCWHAVGCPWPRGLSTTAEVHEAEVRTRERMTARGGTDRHLVRNGRT